MRIRAETSGDQEQIGNLHRAAFSGDAEAQLVDLIRAGEHFIPALSIVALAAQPDGRVLGHVLLSRVGIDDGTQVHGDGVLALAPMAVLPSVQRTGIGSALIRRAIADARQLGERLIVVLGHPDYYPRFGFVPARPLGIRCPYEVPDTAWMALPLESDHPRGTVRYPAAFDAV